MRLQIAPEAFVALLRTLLSCRCPVQWDTESALMEYLKQNRASAPLDYDQLIQIADNEKKETVIHRLRDFSIQGLRKYQESYVIVKEDVLSHFCGSYHWHLIASQLPTSYDLLTNLPQWFVGHMLVPVTLSCDHEGVRGDYAHKDGVVVLRNLFAPAGFAMEQNTRYAVHFAMVISELTEEQYALMAQQLDLVGPFVKARRGVGGIDYSAFQKFGNYFELTKSRYESHRNGWR